MDFTADLVAMYTDAPQVVPDVGMPFRGFLDTPDTQAFEAAQVCDFELQYLSTSADLAKGQRLVIDGQRYKVAGLPRRIGDGLESRAPLVWSA